ncbi:MAG TPA: hypothetical protein VEU07_15355 [Candidatus Acidoferrum sp.]|nr:hypothetical protein [Candidatus Acidoferrum sp.]
MNRRARDSAARRQGYRSARTLRSPGGAAKLGSDTTAAREIVENGRGSIGLFRAHIQKENTFLLPMADNVLSPEDRVELEEAFGRFEADDTGAGVHAAALKLLQELQAESR